MDNHKEIVEQVIVGIDAINCSSETKSKVYLIWMKILLYLILKMNFYLTYHSSLCHYRMSWLFLLLNLFKYVIQYEYNIGTTILLFTGRELRNGCLDGK